MIDYYDKFMRTAIKLAFNYMTGNYRGPGEVVLFLAGVSLYFAVKWAENFEEKSNYWGE